MTKYLLLLLFTVLQASTSNACLNYFYGIDNKGHLHPNEDFTIGFNTNFNVKQLENKLKKLEQKIKIEKDYKLLSDYSVLLLKAGKTKEALDILISLSNSHPNDYQIAANLGTAYELNGNLEKALQYIKRGIALNPNSHEGSEWVHIKILETKLKFVKDKSFLTKNSVLQLTDANKNDSLIRKQLLIQMRERFPFSPGPDEIMASMFIDLGDCYSTTASIEFAKVLYTIAKKYYGATEDLCDKKISEMLNLRNKYADVHPEKNHLEGEHNKTVGISYNSMIDDNNPSKYSINWDKNLIDVKLLLSYVGLKQLDSLSPQQEASIEKKEIVIPNSSTTKEFLKEKETNKTILIFLGSAVLGIIAFLFYKKLKK